MTEPQISFKGLIDNLDAGIYRRTPGPRGKFIFVNSTFERMTGYTLRELNRKAASSLFVEKGLYGRMDREVRAEGRARNEEVQLRKKGKGALWCSATEVAVRQGKSVQWVDGFLEDISVRKEVERELVESKELFRIIFERSAVAIIVTDKDRQIVAWNPFAERMLEMGKDELFNKPIREFYPAAEWRRLNASLKKKDGMLSGIETRIVRKDGNSLDVNMSISLIRDHKGEVAGSIDIIRDITSQKAAENKIRDSENKIRAILDNSPVGIMLIDEQDRIVSWNSFTEQMLGMTKKDLNLKPVRSLYPEKEWEKIRSADIHGLGRKHHLETKVIKKNGQLMDVDLSVNVLKDSAGKVTGSVGILQDITEQKRVQHMLLQAKKTAEEASNAKSLFLANMSHEVRTPINTIMGMVDLTLDTELADEQRDNLCVVKDAADNLLNLLNDILDLSRVEAGKINLEVIDLDVRQVVANVCKGLRILAKNKGLSLEWTVDDATPPVLIGDPVRLRQVLLNLVNNAIKFTHKGKVKVCVKALSVAKKECQLLFSVADEGIGIPEDKQQKVFETFAQADDSTTRHYGGTGLGLAICQRLVEMMKGRIWVESEEFKGSTFFFTAVFGISKAGKARKDKDAPGKPKAGRKDLNGLRILLAEDNIVNQRMTQKILEKKSWKVDVAQNGYEVLEKLNKGPFDLILMDAHMPGLDGLDATRRIREEEKSRNVHIPIIALTARAMNEDRKKCLEVGMDGYVSKPIDRQKLYDAIEEMFIPQSGD